MVTASGGFNPCGERQKNRQIAEEETITTANADTMANRSGPRRSKGLSSDLIVQSEGGSANSPGYKPLNRVKCKKDKKHECGKAKIDPEVF